MMTIEYKNSTHVHTCICLQLGFSILSRPWFSARDHFLCKTSSRTSHIRTRISPEMQRMTERNTKFVCRCSYSQPSRETPESLHESATRIFRSCLQHCLCQLLKKLCSFRCQTTQLVSQSCLKISDCTMSTTSGKFFVFLYFLM